ncbi:hypothetical protein CSKR_102458 [Clonorchis sinensis]|uniref:Uncharacterized protein n=2 Tax=Clonorchis sinensis TaxID=79923 RepID=G7Y378_CLOSI|nr:hypothetical protein CSKR_102458 [Clonorchis sinensis]GAA47415.1 hypothetical protein CLF_100329 [Clonorchis sinensis]
MLTQFVLIAMVLSVMQDGIQGKPVRPDNWYVRSLLENLQNSLDDEPSPGSLADAEYRAFVKRKPQYITGGIRY